MVVLLLLKRVSTKTQGAACGSVPLCKTPKGSLTPRLFHPDYDRRPRNHTGSADPATTEAVAGARGLVQLNCHHRRWGIAPRPENACPGWFRSVAILKAVWGLPCHRRKNPFAPCVSNGIANQSDRLGTNSGLVVRQTPERGSAQYPQPCLRDDG
jgi:hypothetical protein